MSKIILSVMKGRSYLDAQLGGEPVVCVIVYHKYEETCAANDETLLQSEPTKTCSNCETAVIQFQYYVTLLESFAVKPTFFFFEKLL